MPRSKPIVAESDMREQVLDVAREFVQTRGYNAFSYRDLAERIGIKTASIHYYFPSKADLGVALLAGYCDELAAVLEVIGAGKSGSTPPSARRRLEQFIGIFTANLQAGNRMCLGGMLAAEHPTLPEPVQNEVQRFFLQCEAWLAKVLAEGKKRGEFRFDGSPASAARVIMASLEGAMMAARTFNDDRRLREAGRWIVRNLLAGT